MEPVGSQKQFVRATRHVVPKFERCEGKVRKKAWRKDQGALEGQGVERAGTWGGAGRLFMFRYTHRSGYCAEGNPGKERKKYP